MSYHTINEEAARRANDMNSFRDYKAGSATAEYRRMVDAATELAERQKQRVDPMYHEKIDRLLEIYCRKLAENMNASYSIEARCPSILISGGGNFPVRKKERQNAARDRNLEEWNYIQGLLDKIRSVGTGASKWGKLKSGAGWISLDYATKTGTSSSTASKAVTVGSTVTIQAGAVYGGLATSRGAKVPDYVSGKNRRYTVKQIATHKGVQEALLKEITSWVALSYLTVV